MSPVHVDGKVVQPDSQELSGASGHQVLRILAASQVLLALAQPSQ